jgi:hypothetical protein
MRNKRWLFFLIVIGLASLVFNVPAFSFNDTQESRETLRGVTPIYVVIEGVTPALEHSGLSAKQLKKAVERQLRETGIQVVTTTKKQESGGLYVRMNTLKSEMLESSFDIDYYAISITIELIQRCLPLTEKNINASYISSHTALACTWSTSNIYLAGEERLIDIRDCVHELVGHFIKAYVSVNPKQ